VKTVARAAFTFTVATLALGSPVYLRMAENPGLPSLLWLALELQILPAAALFTLDAVLEQVSPRGWRRWRAVLCAVCVLAVARQVQVSFNVPSPSRAWATLLAGVIAVVLAVALAACGRAMLTRFLAACAPALAMWTILIGYGLVPPQARAAQPAVGPRPLAVFILVFDELDRDIIMTNGRVRPQWPNFARLAARSRVFADATANYGYTCASIGSLLTGRLFETAPPPNRYCLQYLPGFATENLLSVLAERFTVRLYAQYLTYCFDAAFQCRGTAYRQVRAPYLPLLEHYVPDEVRAATGSERLLGPSLHTYTVPVFEQFLSDVTGASRGTVSWVHVLMPHAPYVFDADGVIHAREYRESWRADPTEYRRALAAYRRQVYFADRLLGRFLDRLEAVGLADDAIVIVTSDHGFYPLHPFAAPEPIEGFEASGARPRVVLSVRAPGLRPGIVPDGYQHVDFKRLVLGLLDGTGEPAVTTGPKIFCDNEVWRVRDPDGQWRPQVDSEGRVSRCGGAAGPNAYR